MATRALWTGSISFGLVNIPVRIYPATQDRDIRFHLLHDQDKARLQRKLVSSESGKEVHSEHIIRGFEIAKDHYVVVQKDEIASCAPEKSKAIDITDFVDLADIDPIYYEKPYYLAPQPAAGKSYRLLVEAMTRTKNSISLPFDRSEMRSASKPCAIPTRSCRLMKLKCPAITQKSASAN